MVFGGTDRFSVIRRLGEGGMGVVYLARDRERDGVVALKTLPMPDPSKILRLKSEFRALAGITHANLIQLYELVSDGNDWFFTMEYVAGIDFIHHVVGERINDYASTLSAVATPTAPRGSSPGGEPHVQELATLPLTASDRLIAERHAVTNVDRMPFKIDETRLRPALRQLVGAIQSLHLAGILHLDVKPSNVLITPSGRVVVLDFGLAARLDGRELDVPDQAGSMRGTPAYMAPEQVGEGMGEPSDWYGVGVLLYEALTRRLPFQGTMWEILHQKMEHVPPAPSTFNPLVPADLDDLCMALLRPLPSDRITGGELIERVGVDPSAGAIVQTSSFGAHAARARSLIGRDREARELRDAFAEVRTGTGVTVLVHGTSGVGKTALVERFLAELAPDVRVLRSRCYERESVPYKAFDSLLDALCSELIALPSERLDALLPPQTAALARLFPVLEQLPGVETRLRKDRVVPDALERRRQGFTGLRELLRRLAAERPLVIVLDDLQWADLDSCALLEAILRPPSAPPLLVLGCYRDEDTTRSAFLRSVLAATPAEVGGVREIAVGPLSDVDVRELALVGIDGADPGRDAKAELVVRESGGHPYFVAELVLELAASSPSDSAPMLSLDAIIDRRVQRLPDLARELLEVVAIAGRPVSQTVLLSTQRAGAAADRLAEEGALALLQASNMIRTSGARAEDQVEAYHDRVRETVASHVSEAVQRSVHHKLALALESSGAGADELAPHFHAAGDHDKAGQLAARAAETAEHALAFDRAATFLRMAIECSPAATQPWKQRLAEALKNAGRAADAAAAYQDAAATATIPTALELRRRAAEQLLVSGHLDEGSELLGGVLHAVGLRLARSPAQALASVVAHRLFLKLRGLRYHVRPPGTLDEQELTRIDMCWSVAVGLSMVDNVRAADFQARHLLLSLRSGDLERITRAFTFEVGFVSGPGSATEAASRALLRQAGELAQRVGTPYAIGFHTLMAGVREYLAGRWTSALELVESAEQTLRERCSGLTWEVTNAQRFALGSLMYKGDMLEVLRRLPGLLRHANERGNLYVATDLRTRIALPWLAIDDPDRVEHEVKDAFAHWTDKGFHLQHFNSLMALGHKDLYTDDPERARTRLAQQARGLARSRVLRLQVPRIEVLYLRARTALAIAARRRGSEARSLLRDAARAAAAIAGERAPWATPLAALVDATICAARGDDSAIELAEGAARQLAAADMHLHAAVARFRVGELAGGDHGAALIDDARTVMTERGVRVPEQFVAMFAPGPWRGAQ
ncbi:MAG: AAA family ATPase [Kofleriaceae bacterium]